MTSRMLTVEHQTRLAVNIIIEDDTGILVYSLLYITTLFTLFKQISRMVSTVSNELSFLVTDYKSALNFTVKVLAISFNSLAYGLGVRL